jgi:hypothetical protein
MIDIDRDILAQQRVWFTFSSDKVSFTQTNCSSVTFASWDGGRDEEISHEDHKIRRRMRNRRRMEKCTKHRERRA